MTALIQSSTGVTVITVGLSVRVSLTLRQAIDHWRGLILGPRSPFIIGFKLGTYALPIMFLERSAFLYQESNGQ